MFSLIKVPGSKMRNWSSTLIPATMVMPADRRRGVRGWSFSSTSSRVMKSGYFSNPS